LHPALKGYADMNLDLAVADLACEEVTASAVIASEAKQSI
jgi:hypothetical protein